MMSPELPEQARPRPVDVEEVDFSPRPRPTRKPPDPRELSRRRLTDAIEELHASARALNLPPVVVDWKPAEEAQEPSDPELTAYAERLRRRFDDLEAAGSGPQPIPLELMPPPAEPDSYLVEGFIRPGTLVMLAGPPGAAKSWASRQLAIAASAGLSTFLDRYAVPRRLRVLVVDEDNGPNEEYRREELLLAALELERADMAGSARTSLVGVQLDQPGWQQWLRSLLELHHYDLVILDPISEFHGGKELREDPAFRSMLAFFKRLKVDFPQTAIVIVHHTRKRDPKAGGVTNVDEVRGQWGQTPDVIATLIPLGDRRSKWELHKRVPHSALILEQAESGALITVADEATSRTVSQQTDDRVLAAIEAGAERAEEIVKASGLSKAGVYKALGRLASARLISKRAPYQLLEGD